MLGKSGRTEIVMDEQLKKCSVTFWILTLLLSASLDMLVQRASILTEMTLKLAELLYLFVKKLGTLS